MGGGQRMTKIAIVPNAAGTGTFTIEAPNSNSNRTLVLPDAAGELLTDVSDIETQVKAATNATGSAPVFACRAWVNFNGTGTVAIRASGNVSSITDNGTGDYTVNFTTAMPDADYSVGGTTFRVSGVRNNIAPSPHTRTTTGVSVYTSSTSAAAVDADDVHVQIFR
jgi:hypothetical protein